MIIDAKLTVKMYDTFLFQSRAVDNNAIYALGSKYPLVPRFSLLPFSTQYTFGIGILCRFISFYLVVFWIDFLRLQIIKRINDVVLSQKKVIRVHRTGITRKP